MTYRNGMASINGNRWVDLWRAANELITYYNDNHIFIENFRVGKNGALELSAGS